MATFRTITLLMRDNITLGAFTNNLAAFGSMINLIPEGVSVKIPSYSTVNRAVQVAGEFYEINTPLGLFVVKKVLLFKKGH